MAVYSKTGNQTLLAWQDVATGAAIIGTPVDVSTKLAAMIYIRFGRRSGSALTAGFPNIRIAVSPKTSGNDSWSPYFIYQPLVGASIANTTLTAAIAAGVTVIPVTAATNIAVGDILFSGHTTLTTNYELVRVRSISGLNITIEEATTYAHDISAPVTDQAEMVNAIYVDLSGVMRVRVVDDAAGAGVTHAIEVMMATLDAIL